MDSAWSRGKTCSVKRNINHTRVENEEEIDEVFEFGRQLGQGSFGKVIEAINRATTSRFAIKSVNKEKVRFFLFHFFSTPLFFFSIVQFLFHYTHLAFII